MKLSAVIIEDEQHNFNALKHILKKYYPDVNVIGNATNVDDAFEILTNTAPDIIFLDIMLGSSNAFRLLDKLPDLKAKIIFTTAHSDFAIKAIKYAAIDYLMKPLQIDELIDAIDRVKAKISEANALSDNKQKQGANSEKNLIFVQQGKSFHIISLEKVEYLSANGKSTIIHLNDNTHFEEKKAIGEYEDQLVEKGFFRIHNSYIVNIKEIETIHRGLTNHSCIMKSGAKLDIARRRYKEIMNKMIV